MTAAAVPILVDDRPDAALSIYSPEVGAFDDEELALIEGLAADVAFATEAASREQARHQAVEELAELNADLERHVLERTAELEVADAELEAFSYSVSHDLRAPLRALDGFSLALVEDYGDRLDDTAFDSLGRIRAESQRMAHLPEVVLRHVMSNAWKFTAREPSARVEVGFVDGEVGRVFHVRDNGAGFDSPTSTSCSRPSSVACGVIAGVSGRRAKRVRAQRCTSPSSRRGRADEGAALDPAGRRQRRRRRAHAAGAAPESSGQPRGRRP